MVGGVKNTGRNGRRFTCSMGKKGTQRLVCTNGEDIPPCQVKVEEGGSIKCSCEKFRSAMTCPHPLAVAESELCLLDFLARVRSKRKEPNPYKLVRSDLPKSSGKKSSTSKRKGKANNKREPLREFQSSSRPPNVAGVEGIAASARLLCLIQIRRQQLKKTFL